MKKFIFRIWDSPTLTTWANRITTSARFLIVTPLVLKQFDTTEIAVWYLVGSLTVFGTVIQTRMSMTFVRMIAFAMAGAKDLSALKKGGERRGDGKPDWPTLTRAYGTVGFLSLFTALITGLSGWGLGYFSLSKMLAGYDEPSKIWLTLAILIGGQTFRQIFNQYNIVLQGMGLVSLNNRWGILSSMVSTLTGFAVLAAGGGIVLLAAAMQGIMLLTLIRLKLLVRFVHEGKLKDADSITYDKEMLAWAWPPFWKGLLSTIANRGVLQFASVVYARHAPIEAAATFLFSNNMLKTAISFAEAPLISNAPRFSRMLAKGDKAKLRKELTRNSAISQWLFMGIVTSLGLVIPHALDLINANSGFLSPLPWAALTLCYMVQRYLFLGLRLPAMGNDIAYYLDTLVSAGISFATMNLATKHFGIYGLLASMFLPFFLIVNIRPFFLSAPLIDMRPVPYLIKSGIWTIPVFAIIQAIVIIISTGSILDFRAIAP